MAVGRVASSTRAWIVPRHVNEERWSGSQRGQLKPKRYQISKKISGLDAALSYLYVMQFPAEEQPQNSKEARNLFRDDQDSNNGGHRFPVGARRIPLLVDPPFLNLVGIVIGLNPGAPSLWV